MSKSTTRYGVSLMYGDMFSWGSQKKLTTTWFYSQEKAEEFEMEIIGNPKSLFNSDRIDTDIDGAVGYYLQRCSTRAYEVV